jgi:hypothetical protein
MMDSHDLKDKHKERKHKSKKREHHGESDDRRKHKKRKDKGAVVRVVDDDLDGEDMWVEKNIDMDGEKARKVYVFEMVLSNVHSEANCSGYTHCGEPQTDLACSVQT